MSETSTASPVIYIIIAILTAVGGYFTRIFQKYEDRRDEIHLKILPAFYHYIHSFVQSSEIYQERHNFEEFKEKVEDIISKLNDKISSGEVVLAKINSSLLEDLYWRLQKMKAIMDDISRLKCPEKTQRMEEFVDAFANGNARYSRWLTVDPKQMIKDATTIRKEVDHQIKKYKSYSFILVILIIAAAVIAGLANYITTALLEPEENNSSNNQSQASSLDETFPTQNGQTNQSVTRT